MNEQKKTVIFVIDRSGSMENKKQATMESFNQYKLNLQEDDEIEFTLIQFDTISTDILHRRKPIKDVHDLTAEVYQPRAGTPLIDAFCIAIESAKKDYSPTDRVVITVLTDGKENSSREFTMGDLHAKIKECSEWGWQFVFLGASIDNYASGQEMGLKVSGTMSYDSHDVIATANAFEGVAIETRSYFSTGEDIGFSDETKASAGDVHAKNYQDDKGNLPKAKKSFVDRFKL